MSKSILVKEFNKANRVNRENKCFNQSINVSFLDVICENEVSVDVKDYKECLCKDSKHIHNYFIECDKCGGNGVIILNGHNLACNKCHGEKVIRIHDCYLCNNANKLLLDSKLNIKLSNNLKNGDVLKYDFEGYSLELVINIYDLDDYYLKENDIYYLKSVMYSKEDYKNKINKVIYTGKKKHYIASEFKVKKEVYKIENEGINGGDFYFMFENEIEKEKETLFTNVLIDKDGYFNINDLINKEVVISKDSVALNDVCYVYIDESVSEYENDKYIIKLNKLDSTMFSLEDSKLVYNLHLSYEDLDNDKKSLIINNEKINVNFKKNLKEEIYVNINDKVVLDKDGRKKDLLIKVIPYFENVYKIRIKNNKGMVYIEDYKHSDYTLVEAFKKSDYLSDYISVDKQEKLVVNNDLVLIERV